MRFEVVHERDAVSIPYRLATNGTLAVCKGSIRTVSIPYRLATNRKEEKAKSAY